MCGAQVCQRVEAEPCLGRFYRPRNVSGQKQRTQGPSACACANHCQAHENHVHGLFMWPLQVHTQKATDLGRATTSSLPSSLLERKRRCQMDAMEVKRMSCARFCVAFHTTATTRQDALLLSSPPTVVSTRVRSQHDTKAHERKRKGVGEGAVEGAATFWLRRHDSAPLDLPIARTINGSRIR